MRKAGILPEFAGVVVSDRYQNYFHPSWEHFAGNQACLAHILRDYQDCAETYRMPSGPCRRSGRCAASSMPGTRPATSSFPSSPPASPGRWRKSSGTRSSPGWPACPASRPEEQHETEPGRELLEFCNGRQADVLRFTADTSVWPTNNISERGVRPLKTQQKISGRLTSDDVTQDRLDIRSYIDTARKHGLGAWTSSTSSCSAPLAAASTSILPVSPRQPRTTDHPTCMG